MPTKNNLHSDIKISASILPKSLQLPESSDMRKLKKSLKARIDALAHRWKSNVVETELGWSTTDKRTGRYISYEIKYVGSRLTYTLALCLDINTDAKCSCNSLDTVSYVFGTEIMQDSSGNVVFMENRNQAEVFANNITDYFLERRAALRSYEALVADTRSRRLPKST